MSLHKAQAHKPLTRIGLYGLIAASVVTLSALTSCRDFVNDAVEDRYRNRYQDYLHNQTDQDVTVIFCCQGADARKHSYLVPRGKEVQIPHEEFLAVSLRALERDSVVFRFADGSRIVHTYTNTNFGQDSYHFVYEPAVNNIFYTGYDIPSSDDAWVLTHLGTMKMRYDYTIRR